MKKMLASALLCVLMLGCTKSQEAVLLEAIVVATSGVATINLPPQDAQAILTYRNDVLTVVNGLLNSGTTIDGIAAAAASLQSLSIPVVSPQGQAYVGVIALAVQNFISASGQASPITSHEAKALKTRARGRR